MMCEPCSRVAERIGLRLPRMGRRLAPSVFDEHHAEIARLRLSNRMKDRIIEGFIRVYHNGDRYALEVVKTAVRLEALLEREALLP